MENNLEETNLSNLLIRSVDTLRGSEIDQTIPPEWNYDPPILLKVPRPRFVKGKPSEEDAERLLKGMLRLGIPPALRCAIWLSNVVQSVHPEQNQQYWIEYRTLSKIRSLDGAYESVLTQLLSNENKSGGNKESSPKRNDRQNILDTIDTTIWDTMEASKYGRSLDATSIRNIRPSGKFAYKRVLLALDKILGIDFAPLIPTLVACFLTCMSESYAFCAMREMSHQSAMWFFPVSAREHAAWCCAFGDILRKLHPQTAEYLEDRGVLDVEGLAPIFEDFFVNVLPIYYVQRIIDIYTLEGSKVLFRFGVALLVLAKMDAAENLITISRANEWWTAMKNWAHSSRFNFPIVVRKAYGVHGRGLRMQLRFPRRRVIQRIIRLEDDRLQFEGMNNEYDDTVLAAPLGLVRRHFDKEGRELVKPILAEPHTVRQSLAQWLPFSLRLSNLDLIYSTNCHGRTLERFYSHVKNSKHTFVLCEVLRSADDENSTPSSSVPTVLGMYASQAWRSSPRIYGDGGVFLFRLQPEAKCWKWKPEKLAVGGSIMDHVDLEDDGSSNNHAALLEQYMVGTDSFISMGGNPDGSCGLRLNEDLTRGESSSAIGFNNEPLHGLNKGCVFEIGLVEVYGLVRQIDGRASI